MSTNPYSYLKKYIPGGDQINDNWFFPVLVEVIEKCELKMELKFPEQLRNFYEIIGFGVIRSPENRPENYKFYNDNRILPPTIAVDYMLGILEHPGETYYMSEDTYEMLEEGDLPFFEIGDGSSFMVMKLNSDNPNAVWSDCGVKIEDSFERFIWRLYYEDPGYYGEIIEDYYKDK